MGCPHGKGVQPPPAPGAAPSVTRLPRGHRGVFYLLLAELFSYFPMTSAGNKQGRAAIEDKFFMYVNTRYVVGKSVRVQYSSLCAPPLLCWILTPTTKSAEHPTCRCRER